jgi:hypothetical protein
LFVFQFVGNAISLSRYCHSSLPLLPFLFAVIAIPLRCYSHFSLPLLPFLLGVTAIPLRLYSHSSLPSRPFLFIGNAGWHTRSGWYEEKGEWGMVRNVLM